jgi:type II secretory pathway pseudopilin PulG
MQTRSYNESQSIRRRSPGSRAGFLRCWNSPGVLPHPSPLPLGEGVSLSITEGSKGPRFFADGRLFSLSQRERAGAREKLQPTRADHSHSAVAERLRRESGFSLMELLVAVSIMIVIVYALYQVFNQTQRAMRANITQVDVLESGRAALDMMTRELEQIGASQLIGATNLYVGLIPATPFVQTDLDNTRVLRTNVLQEFFFLSPSTNRWVGTGYRVLGADDGVGTLYRFSVSTNYRRLNSTNLSREFMTQAVTNPVTRTLSTNMHRVADGIVHLRLIAFDPAGRRMGFETTNFYPTYNIRRENSRQQELPFSNSKITFNSGISTFVVNSPNVLLRQELAGQTKLLFLSNALPAYLELELGVLEPVTLTQYESMRGSAQAGDFLKKRATKVHLFRQRIPIRTALQ